MKSALHAWGMGAAHCTSTHTRIKLKWQGKWVQNISKMHADWNKNSPKYYITCHQVNWTTKIRVGDMHLIEENTGILLTIQNLQTSTRTVFYKYTHTHTLSILSFCFPLKQYGLLPKHASCNSLNHRHLPWEQQTENHKMKMKCAHKSVYESVYFIHKLSSRWWLIMNSQIQVVKEARENSDPCSVLNNLYSF